MKSLVEFYEGTLITAESTARSGRGSVEGLRRSDERRQLRGNDRGDGQQGCALFVTAGQLDGEHAGATARGEQRNNHGPGGLIAAVDDAGVGGAKGRRNCVVGIDVDA